MIKAILTKPLDGFPEGTEREFDAPDFEALRKMGAVRGADEVRTDGPTVEEFVTAGYRAENYPPQGYASRSTPEEIATAVAAQAGDPADTDTQGGKKAAPPVSNKKAPPADNKAAQ